MVHRGTFIESNNMDSWRNDNQSTDSIGRSKSLSVGWEIGPEWGLNPCPAEPGYILHLQIV